MKKFLALIAAMMLVLSLAACSRDCDVCGKEGEGDNKVTRDGEKAYLCDSCKTLYDFGTSLGY